MGVSCERCGKDLKDLADPLYLGYEGNYRVPLCEKCFKASNKRK